jgi:hypothetical protein
MAAAEASAGAALLPVLLVLVLVLMAMGVYVAAAFMRIIRLDRFTRSLDRRMDNIANAPVNAGKSRRLAFAEFYATMPSDNALPIQPGFAIEFGSPGLSSDDIVRDPVAPTTQFVLPRPGSYRIDVAAALQPLAFAVISDVLTITATSASHVVGHVATHFYEPGTASILPPSTVIGTQYVGDGTADAASASVVAAITYLQNLNYAIPIVGDLSGQTVGPGSYVVAIAASLTGLAPFTLSGRGSYYFRLLDTFVTAAFTKMVLTNGATAANVTWLAANNMVTLGQGSTWQGSIFAQNNIALGANLDTRVITVNGGLYTVGNTMMWNAPVNITAPTLSDGPAPQLAPLGPTTGQLAVALADGAFAPFIEIPRTVTGEVLSGPLPLSTLVKTARRNTRIRIANPSINVLPLVFTPNAGGVSPVTARLIITELAPAAR